MASMLPTSSAQARRAQRASAETAWSSKGTTESESAAHNHPLIGHPCTIPLVMGRMGRGARSKTDCTSAWAFAERARRRPHPLLLQCRPQEQVINRRERNFEGKEGKDPPRSSTPRTDRSDATCNVKIRGVMDNLPSDFEPALGWVQVRGREWCERSVSHSRHKLGVGVVERQRAGALSSRVTLRRGHVYHLQADMVHEPSVLTRHETNEGCKELLPCKSAPRLQPARRRGTWWPAVTLRIARPMCVCVPALQESARSDPMAHSRPGQPPAAGPRGDL